MERSEIVNSLRGISAGYYNFATTKRSACFNPLQQRKQYYTWQSSERQEINIWAMRMTEYEGGGE